MKNTNRLLALVSRLALPAVLAFPVWGWSSANAQTTQPHIAYILPAGGQRGTTVQVGVRGRNLTGATEVRVSGEGVTGKVLAVEQPDAGKKTAKRLDAADNPDLAAIEVTLAPDAKVGERELRLISPGGASNLFRFFVGQVPELNEVEPNSLPEQAQVLPSLPVVVNGQTFQADRDFFRFKAKAGQMLVLELCAQKILPYIADGVPGWFQATLTLYDSQGKELAFVDDFRHHPDPVMFFKVPQEGEYLVEVKDALYRGRDDFVYRLSIGEMPYITHIFPLGGPRNSTAEIELHGVNLPTDQLRLDLPGDSPARRWVQLTAEEFTSNALPFAVGDLPEIRESEPNNSLEKANRIQSPLTVNGRIDPGGDVDYYVFSAEAKQTLVMEVHARRLDSPMDSILTLFDSKGKQLAQNDDTKDESEGLVTHHADSFLRYTFPAAGDYVLAVADVQGKGGEEYAYRLTVAPPRPDFILRVRPDNPRAARGSSALLTVTAFRRDGLSGPIKLSVKGLPEQFAAPDAVIAEKENEARMIITAAAEAPLGLASPRVVGMATVGDREVVHEADPCEELMQAFYYMHNVPSQEFLLQVVEAGPLMLSVEMPPGGVLKIPVRGEVKLPVKATLKGDLKGTISLKPEAPPKGFRIQYTSIPAGQSETTVTITTIGQQVKVGQTGAIVISATMRAGKETISGFVPAIPYEVVRQ
jgi:hypothetical protein